MKVAVLQSNYIPWKGYFDIIAKVDLFVFYDDVQFTKNDWRNRNKIKTPNGSEWITIPCGVNLNRLINEVEVSDSSWRKSHWGKIQQNYRRAPYFNEFKSFFEEFYLQNTMSNLSEINQWLIKKICREILSISTQFDSSSNYTLTGKKESRLLELLQQVGATSYLSGPSAKQYITESHFKDHNIALEWIDYSNYKEYTQLSKPFDHYVSIIDLIFNTGSNIKKYMLQHDSI